MARQNYGQLKIHCTYDGNDVSISDKDFKSLSDYFNEYGLTGAKKLICEVNNTDSKIIMISSMVNIDDDNDMIEFVFVKGNYVYNVVFDYAVEDDGSITIDNPPRWNEIALQVEE